MRALLLLAPLALVHVYIASCLRAIDRRAGGRLSSWAWVPLVNLLLVPRIAGRSLGWSLLLLAPGVNVVVWALLWADIAEALEEPAWLGAAMAVPPLALAVLGWLAGLRGQALATAVALLVACGPSLLAAWRWREAESVELAALGLAHPSVAQREGSARRLRGAGPAAAPAVPALTYALEDEGESVRAEAAGALGAVGPPAAETAVPALVAALGDASERVRGAAARALARIAPGRRVAPADTIVPALLGAARGTGDLQLPDRELVDAIGSLGAGAVPRLGAGLQDPDPGVRWHAAAALIQIGPEAREAIPALFVAMRDDEWAVRNAAGRALEDVATVATVPELGLALADPNPEVRYHVARALGRLGAPAAAALPALAAALRDHDWEVRMEAAWAIGLVGPLAKDAVPGLVACLKDDDSQVRGAAAWSLGRLGRFGEPARPALREALRDPVREVRDAASWALGAIEGRAR